MNYLSLFSPHNLALISDWLAERGELYIDVYWPHRGHSSQPYFIWSINHLKILVSQQDWPEISFTIFRNELYPLRGIADENLLETALKCIPDGQNYSIISLFRFQPPELPESIAIWGMANHMRN